MSSYELSSSIYNRSFTNVKSQLRSIRIQDVLNVTQDTNSSFCFNISLAENASLVIFTTCGGQLQLMHRSHSVFNFVQNMSSGFFGLGERKGEFFLNNRTTYALYNNDNNIIDSHHVDNRVIQHGRNGFHPIIYS